MKQQLILVITMAIEVFLLLVILFIVAVGLLGIFLPVLPGILFISLGVALYGLVLQSERSRAVRRIHPWFQAIGRRLPRLNFSRYRVSPRRWLKRRNTIGQLFHDVVPFSLVMFGLDVALLIGILLGLSLTAPLSRLLIHQVGAGFFWPFLLLLVLAELSAVVWFRCGQVIGRQWKGRAILAASLATGISVLALCLLVLVASSLVGWFAPAGARPLFLLGLMYLTILSAVFKMVVVILGASWHRS